MLTLRMVHKIYRTCAYYECKAQVQFTFFHAALAIEEWSSIPFSRSTNRNIFQCTREASECETKKIYIPLFLRNIFFSLLLIA